MEPMCRGVTKFVLPALRASIAETLNKNHSYKQQDIAERLGIVQVAVSKYLNNRYSGRVREIKEYIDANNLSGGVVASILSGGSTKEIEKQVDALCSNVQLIRLASKKVS